MELLMKQGGVDTAVCPAVDAALAKAEQTGKLAGALTLKDGYTVTGKTSTLLGTSAALLLNALKHLAGIDKETDIIDADALTPICALKTTYFGHRNPRLHADEVLIALSMSSVKSPIAARAMEQLSRLRGTDAHFSAILSPVDEKIYKSLGIYVTCEPKFEVKNSSAAYGTKDGRGC